MTVGKWIININLEKLKKITGRNIIIHWYKQQHHTYPTINQIASLLQDSAYSTVPLLISLSWHQIVFCSKQNRPFIYLQYPLRQWCCDSNDSTLITTQIEYSTVWLLIVVAASNCTHLPSVSTTATASR